jgi:hypothetical protein
MRILLAVLALSLMSAAQAQKCTARSGDKTAVLVELYTSEGCNSCPPADRWLSGLGKKYPPELVVPLALHVDYWDYIGWKDPYAKREFSQRQRRLSQLQRASFVYTPQVMVQGSDFREWGGGAFDRTVTKLHAKPAGARLELEIVGANRDALQVRVVATILDAAQAADAGLYVAAYENRLESQVTAGENSGHLLQHDHVALEWQGPYGPGERQLRLPLLPKAKIGDSGIVAFVQNRRTADILQTLMLGTCSGQGF